MREKKPGFNGHISYLAIQRKLTAITSAGKKPKSITQAAPFLSPFLLWPGAASRAAPEVYKRRSAPGKNQDHLYQSASFEGMVRRGDSTLTVLPKRPYHERSVGV
jgi:hypothetical protein